MKKKEQYMIRLDDITPDMNWENFNRIRAIFEQYQICPLLGVVPDNKDEDLHCESAQEDFWEVMRYLQKKGWMIAQHGTNHKYLTKSKGILGINPFSEFAGLPYDIQLDRIQKGKDILKREGINASIFMAPGHTFDKTTLKALAVSGFECITDGLYKRPYYSEDMLFVPCRLQEYRKVKGIDTICLHSNLMSEADMEELETFCRNNHQNIVPFNVEELKQKAVKRTMWVAIYERWILCLRNGKDRIANSKRLAWYMQYTNDKNSKKKWLKRLFYLPLLLVGREK